MQGFRRYFCQFIPDINGKYQSGEIKNGRIEIFYGKRWQKYWLLPDGSVSMISIEPERSYIFRHGRYVPHKNGPFTVIGTFPFFRISQTGHWVWLNADHSMTFHPVNFIHQANEFERLAQMVQRDYRPPVRRRMKPRNVKKVVTSKIIREGSDYHWAVFVNGKEHAAGMGLDRNDARFAVAQAKSEIER